MFLDLRENEDLLREFLSWWRTQRLEPHPKEDAVRWLIGGSVNLKGTLDSMNIVDRINDLEDVPLPTLTEQEVTMFVREMLTGRGVKIEDGLSQRVVRRLGRPIPLFMQMVTQDLNRCSGKRRLDGDHADHPLTAADADQAFDRLVTSSAAQDKLQHYHSRIDRYYPEPRCSAAYEILDKLSLTTDGINRKTLMQEFERVVLQTGIEIPAHKRKRQFNTLMRDLENDFYIEEIDDGKYDFASGVLKSWWRKYYA